MIDTLFNDGCKFFLNTFEAVAETAISWLPSLPEISRKTAEIALPSLALTATLAAPLIAIFLARRWHLSDRDYVKPLITKKMNATDINELIQAIKPVPRADRLSVIRYANLVKIPEMNGGDLSHLIEAIKLVPKKDRQSVIEDAKPLITPQMSGLGIRKLIEAIAQVPGDDRPSVIGYANLVKIPGMDGGDLSHLIEAIKLVPKKDRQSAIEDAKPLITKQMSGFSIGEIIQVIAQVSEGDRPSIIEHTKPLIAPQMDGFSIGQIIQTIAQVPEGDRPSVIAHTKPLITQQMSGLSIEQIIQAIVEVPEGDRPSVTEHANLLKLKTPEMNGFEIRKIIIALKNIHPGQRKNRVQVILPAIVPGISGDDIVEMLIHSTPIFMVKLSDIGNEQEKQPAHPDRVLRTLDQLVGSYGKFPSIRYDDDFSPQDIGGVTRQFTTCILDAICKQKALTMMSFNGLNIPMIGTQSPLTHIEQEQTLRGIGLLFGEALISSRSTGKRFHPIVFDIIHKFRPEMLFKKEDADDLFLEEEQVNFVERIGTLLYPQVFTPEFTNQDVKDLIQEKNNQKLQERLKALYFPLESPSQQEFCDQFLSQARGIIRATQVITKTMYFRSVSAGKDWNQIKGASPEDLERKIQGFLTKQAVIDAFGDDLKLPVAKHLLTWLHEHDLKDIEKFLFALTGSTTLLANTHLTVSPNITGNQIIAHTCSRNMEVPPGLTYEEFTEKLWMLINSAFVGNGFQLA